jgi:hypothetical protein
MLHKSVLYSTQEGLEQPPNRGYMYLQGICEASSGARRDVFHTCHTLVQRAQENGLASFFCTVSPVSGINKVSLKLKRFCIVWCLSYTITRIWRGE